MPKATRSKSSADLAVVPINTSKAESFLRLLQEHPFLALVVRDGEVHFFACLDFGPEEQEKVLAAIETLMTNNSEDI